MTSHEPMPGSERELTAMTSELDEMHRDAMPDVYASVAEWVDRIDIDRATRSRSSRRGFLLGSGAALGAVVLAACGSSKSSNPSTPSTMSRGAGGPTPTTTGASPDLKVAALAASLENLAVATYRAGIDAATAGKLGSVPPAVVTFAQTAQRQHRDHAAAWNAVLSAANMPKVSGVDTTVKTAVVDPAFSKVGDVAGLAKLALQLEEVAAATYLSGITALTSKGGIQTAASIQPVEMQHAAILHFVLGDYPVPRTFASTDGARPLSDQIG